MKRELLTSRLRLVPVETQDCDLILTMLRNDHIKKYLCDNKDIEKDVVESMIRKSDSLFEEKGIGLGSIYDGDTLRVVRGNEEKKIRFCGTDAPEIKQKLGVESRDYLRSLIAKGDGTIYVLEVEQDRYGRTVAELFMPLKDNPDQEIHLNTEMIMAGMAWHYKQYSGNCPNQYGFEIAESIAKEEKVGVYSGSHIEPWLWRSANK